MPWSSGTSSGTWSPGLVRLTSAPKTAKQSAAAPGDSAEDSAPTVAFAITAPVDPAEPNEPNKAIKANSPPNPAGAAGGAAAARPPVFDWEAWRARTGGADRPAAIEDGPAAIQDGPAAVEDRPPAVEDRPPSPSAAEDEHPDRDAGAADRRWSRRSGVAVLAIVAICALLGGFAAFAATVGGPVASPAAAPSIGPAATIAPGDATGTLAPGHAGVGPHRVSSGGHGDPRAASPDPSVSPLREPAGQPAAAAAAAGQADPFSAAVTAYLAGRAGTVLAAVYDVGTGQTWTLGAGRPQPTGSILKVDILQTLLARHPFGLPAADQPVARSMIENSSNPAATTLWNQVGRAAGLRAYNASAGLNQTTPSTCLVCAGFGWPGWGLTTTTPADQLLLLRELVNGPLLSPADRSYALSLMENVEPDQRWGVSGGVPPGVRVALKNAWVPLTAPDTDWQINSEGWISGDGRDYLIAVLATGNPDEQYGIDTINTLSALLWPALG
jgi:beta-lactamase class A